MSFETSSRRLVMRYANRNAFSFNNVANNAADQGMYDLARAFASVQAVQPTKISTVLVRRIVG